tara:strand:+ start:8864 stop:9142 length:279 start_codon:yes stop_codon:yes gene_type:complete
MKNYNQIKLKISNLLNDSKFWLKLERFTGYDIDLDILEERIAAVEEYIAEQYIEAIEEQEEKPEHCKFCGEEVEALQYCSYECDVADNTEGV